MTVSTQERQILMVMRRLLGNIVKETTPPTGMRHPLCDNTLQDVKMAFGLIAARERELADAAGLDQERPYFSDEPPAAKVIPIHAIGKVKKIPE